MAKVPAFEVESHPKGKDLDYFADRVSKFARDLKTILVKLTFGDNFFQYTWSGSFAGSEEKTIPHPLKRIPSGIIVLLTQQGRIVRSTSFPTWTTDVITLRNLSAAPDPEVKIVILG